MDKETFYHLCDDCGKYYPVSLKNIIELHKEFGEDMNYDRCPECGKIYVLNQFNAEVDATQMGAGELLTLRS